MKKKPDIAKCVGCGCTDVCACLNDLTGEACYWLRLDRERGQGVCSECGEHVARWDASVREANEEARPNA